MQASAAAEVIRLYMEVLDDLPEYQTDLAEKVGEHLTALGGFWDVLFLGEAFSYSMLCLEYVELASTEWNVLLCREAVDAVDAEDCGDSPLTRYVNGTLSAGLASPAVAATTVKPGALYKNFWVTNESLARSISEPRLLANLNAELAAGRLKLYESSSADAVRQRLEALWPHVAWNVLVEAKALSQRFYAEEQFSLVVDGAASGDSSEANGLTISAFDRRCKTLRSVDALQDIGADAAILAKFLNQ